MSKPVKQMVTDELKVRYDGFVSACVIDMTGMDVQKQQKLRGAIRVKKGRVQVVKNSLARRAFEGGPLEMLGGVLEGPCAIVVGTESIIDIAKTLVEAAKEFKELKLKQAVFEGVPELLTVESLAKMKGMNELLGELAMLVSSPGRSIAGCLASPQSKIAGCLKTLIDKAA